MQGQTLYDLCHMNVMACHGDVGESLQMNTTSVIVIFISDQAH